MKPFAARDLRNLVAAMDQQTRAINVLAANIAALVESNMMLVEAVVERAEQSDPSDTQTMDPD